MRFLILYLLAGLAVAYVPLTKNKEPVPGRYIVKLKENVDPSSLLDIIYQIADLDSSVEVFQRYEKVFNGFSATLSKGLLSTIQEFDVVESIEEDGIVHVEGVPSWGLDRVDQINLPLDDSFEPIGYGEGVNIYVIDTGIDNAHDEFKGRNITLYSVIGGDGVDCNGHGTHCAATAAGNTYGIAKEANIIGIRCMQCGGAGTISDIVAACEWIVSNATTPAVVSMSIGGAASKDLDEAVEAVNNQSGILMVVAAGNGGTDACTWSPSRVSSVLAVGATDKTDNTWSDSNIGTCVDIMAPGVDIVSAWIGGTTATKTLSGTSMSAPHAAGAAAVLLAKNISQTPEELKANLQEKASAGVMQDSDPGTPNLLLYVGEGSGGGSVPTEPPPPTPCGTTITVSGSQITSPNYPDLYGNNENCQYFVDSSSSDLAVMISFSYFDVEYGVDCVYDKLTIYDGDSENANELANLCGDSTPDPVYTSSSKMFLVFKSDDSVTKIGFKSNVYFVDKDSVPGQCVYDIRTSGSVITSPNYPDNYGNNENCQYTVVADSNYWIELTFTAMDIEDDDTCSYDKLRVYDGSSSANDLLATLCGSTNPGPIYSSTNQMFLHFTSDYSVTLQGFQATVTFLTSQQPTTEGTTTVEVSTTMSTTKKPSTVGDITVKPTTEKPTTVEDSTTKSTTNKPTTVDDSTTKSTTNKPTTVNDITTKSTTKKPTTVDDSTTKSTTNKPTTVNDITTKSTTKKPTTVDDSTTKSTTNKPTTVNDITTKSTTKKPTTVDDSTTKSTTNKPTTVNDITTKSTTKKPTTVDDSTTKSTTNKPTTVNDITTKSTTKKPTTVDDSTTKSTTNKPTTVNDITTKSTTKKPTTVDDSTTKSTTNKPTTVNDITTKSTTKKPTTVDDSTTKSTTNKPTTVNDITTKSTTKKPTTVDDSTTKSTTNKPTTVNDITVKPSTEKQITAGDTPVDPTTKKPTTVNNIPSTQNSE